MERLIDKYGRSLLTVLGVGLGAYYFSTVLLYIIGAVLMSLVLRPVVHWLQRHKVFGLQCNATAAATVAILIFFLVVLIFLAIIVPLIIAELQLLSDIKPENLAQALEGPIEQYKQFLKERGIEFELEAFLKEFVNKRLQTLTDFSTLSNTLGSIFATIGQLFLGIFSIAFIGFFLLRDRKLAPMVMLYLSPAKYNRKMLRVVYKSKYLLRRYFIGILMQVTIMTTIVSAGLSIVGVHGPLFFGFFTAVVNVVPYLGPIIGFSFTTFMAAAVALNSGESAIGLLILKVGAVFAVAQLVDNFFNQPFIYGNSVKAHPLEVFIVILLAGTMAGIPGMVAAIPAYTVIRVVASEFAANNVVIAEVTREMSETADRHRQRNRRHPDEQDAES